MGREPIIQGGNETLASGRREPAGGTGGLTPPRSPKRDSAFGGFDPDDARYDEELRPQRLEDVVGQRKVVQRLRIMLDAARKRGEPLGHLLLDGPPGIGKTTLATVLPKELGSDIQITSGPSLAAPKDLLPYVSNAAAGSVLFIDEIHRLPPAVEEFLYPAMEDFRIDIALGEGLNARTVNLNLHRFTVIGATTRSGLLTAPLRDRFLAAEHLDFYEVEEVTDIVTRNARKLKTDITENAAYEIARRSRGTPRKANNLLRWARDFATVHAGRVESPESRVESGTTQHSALSTQHWTHITTPLADEALAMLEVDELGLEPRDRRYLETLITVFGGGPAGLNAVGHSMNVPPDTLEDEVEPFLLRCGFLQRTPRGRMVTRAALAHLKRQPPDSEGDSGQGRLF